MHGANCRKMRKWAFRAWDGQQFWYVVDILADGCIVGWDTEKAEDAFNSKIIGSFRDNSIVRQITLEQYIGLRDKNDIKIYEGDIVETIASPEPNSESRVGVVKYSEKWATYYLAMENEKGCGIALTDIFSWYYNGEDGDVVAEVIGNIHEDPKLLTKG